MSKRGWGSTLVLLPYKTVAKIVFKCSCGKVVWNQEPAVMVPATNKLECAQCGAAIIRERLVPA